MAYVNYDKEDHIAVITLNRPDRLNAFGRDLMRQLVEVETRFAEDDDAWVAIYTGAGDRAFSAGRDLKEAATSTEQPARSSTPRRRGFADHVKPTIAAVNGYCTAGGLELSLVISGSAQRALSLRFRRSRWVCALRAAR